MRSHASRPRNSRRTWRWLVGGGALFIAAGIVGVRGALQVLSRVHWRVLGQYEFALAPNGHQIVFAGNGNGGHDLYRFDLKSRRVTRLTNTEAWESYPAFSPDGTALVYAAAAPGERARHIFVRPVNGTRARQLTHEHRDDTMPQFSPDGKWIVFTRGQQQATFPGATGSWLNWNVWAIRADGTQLRQLTRLEAYQKASGNNSLENAPKISPDGRQLVFQTNAGSDGTPAIYHLRLSEMKAVGPIKRITTEKEGRCWGPTFSPNGQDIAFTSDLSAPYWYSLHTASLKTGVRRRVTTARTDDSPLFAPDGKSLYFISRLPTSGGSGFDGVWQVDQDGRHRHQVLSTALFQEPSS